MKLCPCYSQKRYAECCQPFHEGTPPPTALLLMRSRYAAYALQRPDYIMQTTHPQNPSYNSNSKEWAQQILQFCLHTQFEGLEILDDQEGSLVAFVTFTARLKQQGRDGSFTEKSRFEKVAGKWLYHSGTFR